MLQFKDIQLLEESLREKLKDNFFDKRPDGSLAAAPASRGDIQG